VSIGFLIFNCRLIRKNLRHTWLSTLIHAQTYTHWMLIAGHTTLRKHSERTRSRECSMEEMEAVWKKWKRNSKTSSTMAAVLAVNIS
jgi:hypothetical protein